MNKTIIFQTLKCVCKWDILSYSTRYRFLCTEVKEKLRQETNEKLVRVAIIGVPNAGKSTFINNLIDRRVCPTSNKVHTTRNCSRAVFNKNSNQVVLFDTPGLVSEREVKKHNLESTFISSWRHSIQHSDLIGVIHDVSNSWTRNELHPVVLKCLQEYPKVPSFLVLNKVDLLKSKRVLLDVVKLLTNNKLKPKGRIFRKLNEKKPEEKENLSNTVGWDNFSDVFMVSSVTGNGLDRVMDFILQQSKFQFWDFKPNNFSDQAPEDLIVQSVRARLLDYLPQEIPYLLKCELEYYSNEKGKIFASVQVTCPNSRIERLVSGEGNGKLRQITERITSDLVETFSVPITLTVVTNIKTKIN